jgi:hypothetical protein
MKPGSACVLATLLALAAVAPSGVAALTASFFTIRSEGFENGNIALTYPDFRDALQGRLVALLDIGKTANTSTLRLDYITNTTSQECVLSEMLCYLTMTVYFVGGTGTDGPKFAKGLLDMTSPAAKLKVDGFAVGTTVPARVVVVPTITGFILTLVFGYLAFTLALLVIFLFLRWRLLKN